MDSFFFRDKVDKYYVMVMTMIHCGMIMAIIRRDFRPFKHPGSLNEMCKNIMHVIIAKWLMGPRWTSHHIWRSSGSMCNCHLGWAVHQETKPPSWTEHQREPRMGEHGLLEFWTVNILGEKTPNFEGLVQQLNDVHASHQHCSLSQAQRFLCNYPGPRCLREARKGLGSGGQQVDIVAGSWRWR